LRKKKPSPLEGGKDLAKGKAMALGKGN